ncbi:MAG: YDG domain-containing protein, partial [Clostridiales bacterium]|nr:YDG domain-containing protein [Clostridiales bacterium]
GADKGNYSVVIDVTVNITAAPNEPDDTNPEIPIGDENEEKIESLIEEIGELTGEDGKRIYDAIDHAKDFADRLTEIRDIDGIESAELVIEQDGEAVSAMRNVGTYDLILTVKAITNKTPGWVFKDGKTEKVATWTVEITKKTVTVTVQAKDRDYDGTNIVEILNISVSGILEGDDLAVAAETGTMADASVGNGKPFTVNATIEGADKDNYETVYTGNTVKINATNTTSPDPENPGDPCIVDEDAIKAEINTAEAGSTLKANYDGAAHTDEALEGFLNGLKGIDGIADAVVKGYKKADGSTANVLKDAGIYTVEIELTADEKAEAPAEAWAFANGEKTYTVYVTYTIDKIKLMVKGITAVDRVYDGTTKVDLNTDGMTIEGWATDADKDEFTLVIAPKGTIGNADAGTNKTVTLDISGTALGNYIVEYAPVRVNILEELGALWDLFLLISSTGAALYSWFAYISQKRKEDSFEL